MLENQWTKQLKARLPLSPASWEKTFWPVAEAQFAAPNATEAAKNRGYIAAVNALVTKIFPMEALNKQKSYMNWHLHKPMEIKVCFYEERMQLLNTYLKEFPPFNNNQSLLENAVVEMIAYHGLPHTWEDFLLMQDFDEQEGNIATLLDISQRIDTMEEWSETKKAATGKRDCFVSEKSDKTPNKKPKVDYFCDNNEPS